MLVPPIAHLEAIDRGTLNLALHGQWHRPEFRASLFHGLFHNGQLVAVTAADALIRETCAGLDRTEAIELGRLCAARPGLCRVMLRLWREFVFPALGYRWVVSYQDAVQHSGNLYRFDGWIKLGTSSSGTDQRSQRRGRRKVIWGWSSAAEVMQRGVA